MKERGLELRVEHIGGIDVVHAHGEVDIGNAERLEHALAGTTAARVALDVGGLGYVDSAGIRAIERCYRRLASQRRTLAVISPPGSQAHWTFQVAGFGDGLLYDDLDAVTAAGPT